MDPRGRQTYLRVVMPTLEEFKAGVPCHPGYCPLGYVVRSSAYLGYSAGR